MSLDSLALGSASILSKLDICLFVLSLFMSVAIGVYFANKNKTLDDFMLGGRDQKLLPVSVSMMTSFISGLTLIGASSELYYNGPAFAMNSYAALLSFPFTGLILLPVFYRLESFSLFSYLELRYNRLTRQLISMTFILQMCLYNAVVLYVPSLSLHSFLGISDTVSIGLVGAACLVYSTLGGIKAVIWTDFFQAFLMYSSLLAICVFGTLEVGGFNRLIEINLEGSRLSFVETNFFKTDLTTRHTYLTVSLGLTLINVFMNGANQIQVQRALSLPTLRLAQWSQFISAALMAAIYLVAASIGLILYANYRDCDPYLSGQIDRPDSLLIYYIATHLSYLNGIRGVFAAGIFAATLSTLSSFQNSMSGLVLEDFIKPAMEGRGKCLSDSTITRLSKLLSLLFGLICLSLTFFVGRISGLLQLAITLFGALGSPFICAFFMGVLTRFINATGILIGMLVGFTFGIYVQLYQTFNQAQQFQPILQLSTSQCYANATNSSSPFLQLHKPRFLQTINQTANFSEQPMETFNIGQISYLWIPPIAFTLTAVIASLVSLLTGGARQQVDDKYLIAWMHRSRQSDKSKKSYNFGN